MQVKLFTKYLSQNYVTGFQTHFQKSFQEFLQILKNAKTLSKIFEAKNQNL